MANISDKVAQIREATYGKEVRESIASGIEDINTEVESTTQRQTTLETDMADAKREAEEAAVRANTAAGDAEDITEALAVWEDYDPDADYIPMNKVVYQGSCYINIVACKGVLPTNQTNWLKIASKGLKGNTGAVPDISIGTVTTVAAGTSASVTRRAGSTDESPILDFDIPKGYDGEGAGDMTKFDYDSNNDGKVDAADIADSVPDNTITDAKLSDTAGQIKARFTSHLAENAAHAELVDRTITVGVGKDFTTIQAAISSIKKHVLANIYVNVDPGTYNENVTIKGFYGGGGIYLNGASELADTHIAISVSTQGCNLKVYVTGFKASSPNCFEAKHSTFVQYNYCKTEEVVAGGAVTFDAASGIIANSLISNRLVALHIINNSHVLSNNNSGIGNTTVLNALGGSVIAKQGTQPAGTTAESAGSGGVIR